MSAALPGSGEVKMNGVLRFALAFYMDRQKEERDRGVTIACTTKKPYTNEWHLTIIDAPGKRVFIKNMQVNSEKEHLSFVICRPVEFALHHHLCPRPS